MIDLIGATENMPSGHALKPGDIVRAKYRHDDRDHQHGCRGPARAGRLPGVRGRARRRAHVDFATLTGAIVTTFGDTHAGLFGSDDEWCDAVTEAGQRAGELVWRLPLHPDYAKAIEGRYADIVNAVETRKAGSIVAAEFLKRFTGDVPWAHVDIAGTATAGRPTPPRAATGFGVRMPELASARRAGATEVRLAALGLLLFAVYAATLSIPATAGEATRATSCTTCWRRARDEDGDLDLAPYASAVARVPAGRCRRAGRWCSAAARAAGRRDAAGDLAGVRARRERARSSC